MGNLLPWGEVRRHVLATADDAYPAAACAMSGLEDTRLCLGKCIASPRRGCEHCAHKSTIKYKPMKLYGSDNREMMQVSTIERDGTDLLIKGKIFGTMPLTAKLRPEEARAAFKLLGFRTIFFILTMFFRRSKR